MWEAPLFFNFQYLLPIHPISCLNLVIVLTMSTEEVRIYDLKGLISQRLGTECTHTSCAN